MGSNLRDKLAQNVGPFKIGKITVADLVCNILRNTFFIKKLPNSDFSEAFRIFFLVFTLMTALVPLYR